MPSSIRVSQGQTLGELARKHGVSVQEIAKANGISNVDLIRTGQSLKMPERSVRSSFRGSGGPTSSPEGGAGTQAGGATAPTGATGTPNAGGFVNPVQGGRLSSGNGSRAGGFHDGADIAAPVGTPIASPAAGEVIAVNRNASGYGYMMQIKLDNGDVVEMGHMNEMFKKVGDRVKAGDVVAEVGNRGQSSGPHLHIRMRTNGATSGRGIDPVGYFQQQGIQLGA